MKKAQMFLLTFVFLSGLVVAVAGLISQYSQIDLSEPYLTSDAFLVKSIESTFESALTDNCSKANQNLEEMKNWFERQAFYPMQTDWSLNCSNFNWSAPWPAPMQLNFSLTAPGREAKASFGLYQQCFDSDGGDNSAVTGYVRAARDPWVSSCSGGGPFSWGQIGYCELFRISHFRQYRNCQFYNKFFDYWELSNNSEYNEYYGSLLVF